MQRYFFEYGAVQERTDAGPRRIIECSTSAMQPEKISEELGRAIVDALNEREIQRLGREDVEKLVSEVLKGEIKVSQLSDMNFMRLLEGLGKMYMARVMNCVDGTGRYDKEWTALAQIFTRIESGC